MFTNHYDNQLKINFHKEKLDFSGLNWRICHFLVVCLLHSGPSLTLCAALTASLSHRVGPQGPNGAALPVLWEKRPRPQLHAVQALLLHVLCTRVRRCHMFECLGAAVRQDVVNSHMSRRRTASLCFSVRFNVRLTKRLRALSAGSRAEKPRPALNRAESVPGKPLLLRLVGNRTDHGLKRCMNLQGRLQLQLLGSNPNPQ